MMDNLTRKRCLARVCLAGLLLTILAITVQATKMIRLGISGRFHFHRDQVYFIQGTGSATGLDLATGKVVLRSKEMPSGNPNVQSFTIELPDENKSLELFGRDGGSFYEATMYDTHIVGGRLVTASRNGKITCYSLQTGKVLWSIQGPRQSRMTANSDLVALRMAYNRDAEEIIVLDFDNGRVLWRKKPHEDFDFIATYLEGNRVWLAKRLDVEGRPPPHPTHLVVFDREGNELRELSIPGDTKFSGSWPRVGFRLADKEFTQNGSVRPVSAGPMSSHVEFERALHLSDGVLLFGYVPPKYPRLGVVLEYRSSTNTWRSLLRLVNKGWITEAAVRGDHLLLGTNDCQVHWIDLATGRSEWVYVFASYGAVASYSRGAMLPYLTARRANYRQVQRNLIENARGLIPLPVDFIPTAKNLPKLLARTPRTTPIIKDPNPDDPFARMRIGRSLRVVWCYILGAVLVVAGVVWYWWKSWRQGRDRTFVALGGLGIAAGLAVLGLMMKGRVSHTATVALKIEFFLAVCGGLNCAGWWFCERRWLAGAITMAIIAGGVYYLRYLLWFA